MIKSKNQSQVTNSYMSNSVHQVFILSRVACAVARLGHFVTLVIMSGN